MSWQGGDSSKTTFRKITFTENMTEKLFVAALGINNQVFLTGAAILMLLLS